MWVIIILVVLIATLIGLKAAGVIGKDEGIKVTMEKAAKGTIIETVNASGKIYPEIEVRVSPDISGQVVDLYVNEGDSVTQGQVVAKIYAGIYASQRDQAAAGVAQSEAQKANASAALGSLEATVSQTKTTYDRQKRLLDEKVISRAEFEQADQAYKVAQANYKAAKEGLKSNSASIQSAKANLNKASKDMSRATITAPMDGVVSLLNVKKGERVAGNSFSLGTEMMRIADLNSIVAQVDVGENDIPKVKFGDTAIVEIDAYSKRKFKGIVFKIANPSLSSSAAGAANDVTNYRVHIRLLPSSYMDLMGKGKPFPFRPNMSASADIQTHTVKDVLSVPLQAVTTRNKKNDPTNGDKKNDSKTTNTATKTTSDEDIDEIVFVVQKEGNVKMVKVKTGVQDINNIQITEGLKEGDEVITGPYSTVSKTLKEGTKVKVVAKDKLYDDKKTN